MLLFSDTVEWKFSLLADAISNSWLARLRFDRLELAADRRLAASKSDPTGDRNGTECWLCCWRRKAAAVLNSCGVVMFSKWIGGPLLARHAHDELVIATMSKRTWANQLFIEEADWQREETLL